MGEYEDVENLQDDGDDNVIDMKEIGVIIRDGAKAGRKLKDHAAAGGLWPLWCPLLRGLGGMRSICWEKTGTSEANADANKKQMASMMESGKYEIYAYHFWGNEPSKKRLRSDAYKMLDHLDEIDEWYNGSDVSDADRLAWNHPSTIVKHCPPEYLSGGMGHNQPKPKQGGPKKKMVDIETDRMLALLMEAIGELMDCKPVIAKKLLAQVKPPFNPSDPVDDVAAE